MLSIHSFLVAGVVYICVVGAIAIPPGDRAVHVRQQATISPTDLTTFLLISQYAAASYCPTNTNTNSTGTILTCTTPNLCPDLTRSQAKTSLSATFDPVTDNKGFLAIDPTNNLIVLSFRGSHSVRNFIADALFVRTAFNIEGECKHCSVHSGFLAAWNLAKPTLIPAIRAAQAANPTFRLVATGHSLGAAIATLAAVEMRTLGLVVDLITFGSPRVGDKDFANFATAQAPAKGVNMRMTHLDDPVPRLPPSGIVFGYEHVSPEFWLSSGTASTVDYRVEDVRICPGVGNRDCNAGTDGFDVEAHNFYLRPIAGCAPEGLSFRRVV